MSEIFQVNMKCFGYVILEKILKIFSYINTDKNDFPYSDPTLPLGP
jgi:hypothetical protein